MPNRTCWKCKVKKPLTEFRKLKTSSTGRGWICLICVSQTAKDRYNAKPEKERKEIWRRRQWYRRLGKDAVAVIAELEAKQQGLCAICNQPEKCKSRGGGIKALAVDHDHKTLKVRQLLCHDCNIGIGKFYENPDLLAAAAEYIKRHS